MGRDCVWCENALIECELWKKIISNEEIKLRRSCCYDVVRCSVPMLYCLNGGCVQHTSWCSYSKLVSPRRWFDDSKLGLWTISMRRKTMLWRWLLHLMACGWWRCPTQGRTLLNYQSVPSSRISFLITDSQWSNFHSEVTHPHRKKCAVPWPGHVICLQQRRLRTQWVSLLDWNSPKLGNGDCGWLWWYWW